MSSSSDSDSSRKRCLSFLPVEKCYFKLQLNLRIHLGGKLGTGLTNLTRVFKEGSVVFVFLVCHHQTEQAVPSSVRSFSRDEMQAGARAEKASLTFM